MNPKKMALKELTKTWKQLENVQFTNRDFRDFFKQFQERTKSKAFIYCDPPYINTDGSYENNFTKPDFTDLLNLLIESTCKFAVSEFDDPFIITEAKKRNLNIEVIGARCNLKNRRNEILITNYQNDIKLF